ncbi:DUF1634 domain-containing protein [Anabaena cylindrica FACHB-243]|uniref:DUF1634 domain-containing protein n=1 Tax=Anabaena cylindrica (strain ATCC 27899 / PCC 7122) TaxID=272123 RepID=K9ZEK8_ANACC|nr:MULTISPECIES: DUF1634 domain-containing protein [Anabaena]AFZ56785.1 protein of unknown function DUF1634 [Anabaena cylindrica PCC 7122]MBD2418579.1 DUF1634 domain-containing protein [Anabaena cylindrica FACHB-243]MBY5283591.1 DUF1634 domain-containing protein [Anabaena sp. CCAP 1446/1C]MBY5309950.1 DUF1634 domain-containing protein [Anabaena sp. CCAP 1446/1C]MCM2409325.1 DUF1634 domain-containing protein [Anabaena sp. CCAP 1446/1C]
MYKLNSGFRWTCTTQIETKVGTFAFELEERDSDIQELEEQRFNHAAQISHHDENVSNQKLTKSTSEKQLEYLLSNLLKYGVLIASSVVLFGGILYLIHHGSEPAEYQVFLGTPSEFRSPTGVVNAVLAGSRRGIIQLGLLLLIAIPILRVFISFFTFLLQRNFIYVIITSLVLVSLTYSLIGAYY